MTRYVRVSVIFVTLLLLVGALGVPRAKAQTLTDILKLMQSHKEALQTLQADVRMAKWQSQLKITDTQKGDVSFIPGAGRKGFVRINWTYPVKEIFVVVKDRYTLYRPSLGQAIKGKVDGKGNGKAGNILGFMSMSKQQLRLNFNVSLLGNSTLGSSRVWHLKLKPKTKQSYKSAELWVDRNGMPIQAKVVEKNNDSSTIRLSNIRKNVRIKGSIFNLKLPGKVRIIPG